MKFFKKYSLLVYNLHVFIGFDHNIIKKWSVRMKLAIPKNFAINLMLLNNFRNTIDLSQSYELFLVDSKGCKKWSIPDISFAGRS